MTSHQVVELVLNIVFWGLVALLVPRRTRKRAAITLASTIVLFFALVGALVYGPHGA